MTPDHTALADDRLLAPLMGEAGFKGTLDAFRSLLEGVAAAPEAADSDAWTVLVAPDASDDLKRQLNDALRRLSSTPPLVARGDRLRLLREELARRDLDGFVVPRADQFQGEYMPARTERLAWLTGFAGSAGLAIVLRDRAAMFVDGRYTLQVRDQVDNEAFEFRHLTEDPHAEWAADALPAGGRLGFDPWLHTAPWADGMRKALERKGAALVPVEDNPVDAVWPNQPPMPLAPVRPHPIEYAGRSAEEKRTELAAALEKDGLDAAVLTSPESVAWLLNIRGGDVPRTPLPLSFAILKSSGDVDLFIDRRKLTPGMEGHLGNRVVILPMDSFGEALDGLASDQPIAVDPSTAAAWAMDRLNKAGAIVRKRHDPCALPRARKNPVELAGARNAHERDAVAIARFLAWIDREAPGGAVDELTAAERLRAFRAEDALYRDLSFDTISGAGPNGAIVHYRSTPETNRRLERGSLYLVDSGAQYLDGTTDITRTIAVGEPEAAMRRHFTLVLKGHIALAVARFPKGTSGSQLDVLARRFLWQEGLDYDHGTGHGVGSYLGVHEGPARISKLPNTVALEPGMILSDEPGYYKTGAYGIRIENLLAVQADEAAGEGGKPFLSFETLTLAPIDRRLIDASLLSPAERTWVDAYHSRVRAVVSPGLDDADRAWLDAATAAL